MPWKHTIAGDKAFCAGTGTKLKANTSVRQTRDREGLEEEIERIKEQMIVAADVNQSATNYAEFKPMVEQVEWNLGALHKDGSADTGYSSYDSLEYAQVKGLDIYMLDNRLEASGTLFSSECIR